MLPSFRKWMAEAVSPSHTYVHEVRLYDRLQDRQRDLPGF